MMRALRLPPALRRDRLAANQKPDVSSRPQPALPETRSLPRLQRQLNNPPLLRDRTPYTHLAVSMSPSFQVGRRMSRVGTQDAYK
jgi:hypothetical protein